VDDKDFHLDSEAGLVKMTHQSSSYLLLTWLLLHLSPCLQGFGFNSAPSNPSELYVPPPNSLSSENPDDALDFETQKLQVLKDELQILRMGLTKSFIAVHSRKKRGESCACA
jgi:hypothetical protein